MSLFQSGENFRERRKERDVRTTNIIAAKSVADAVRTSLGPRGMDKMIRKGDGEVLITNDGATILSQMEVFHPTSKMLVELSKAQDIEAGDGTTSVCVLAGSLLNACTDLLNQGIHPTRIAESFNMAVAKAEEILQGMSNPLTLDDRETIIDAVNTCLSSKVVFQNADILSPIAVDAVMSVLESSSATNVDLNDIKIVKQVGGTIDDTELVRGLVLEKGCKRTAGGPTSMEDARIGLIQFHLSAPKTDMDNNIVVSDYAALDRLMREERKHILTLCKKIKKTGCNVLLIQKSVLRDAYTDHALHFLAKMGIMVVTDIDRKDVEFISRTLGLLPAAHVDTFTEDKLGFAERVEDVSMPGGGSSDRVVKITGVANPGNTITILMRGVSRLVLDEADRSMHDALCVVRALVKQRFMICGGSAPEVQTSVRLSEWAHSLTGMTGYCVRAYAEALEIIPYTLAENAGLNPIQIVTELKARHVAGETSCGIDAKSGQIQNMWDNRIIQPLLVSLSALKLATECVGMILKIDDMVLVR